MAGVLNTWAAKDLIPAYTTWNRQNPMAVPAQCGRYRPDFIYELPTSVVMCEFDENQHCAYTLRCELLRMAEVSLGYGGCPVHWVRYNPDVFRVYGKKVEVSDATRHGVVLEQLQRVVADRGFEYLITVTYVCYSVNSSKRSMVDVDGGGGDCVMVRLFRFKTVEEYMIWVEGRIGLAEKAVAVV